MSAAGAPTSLIVGGALAHHLHSGPYDAVSQTLSVLAADSGSRWAMTAGFVITACCHVVTAMGLRVLPPTPRIALALAGVFGLAVAVFRQPVHGSSAMHVWSVAAGLLILGIWPLLAMSRDPSAPAACRVRYTTVATGVLLALLVWLIIETQGGSLLGVAERICVVAQTLWPLAVTASARRHDLALGDNGAVAKRLAATRTQLR
ncbi:DUF998 domain-containing protein [Antrihabitans cavernicola]|uniref:DUF998 domain-containing protein n=1 Tax=Antrihabitans cavernicola TaxID=2495913 RepID=UPI001658CEAF|nr:DUF998 domain-containing protein [Spelaeibacter cavernicola]